MVDSVSSNSSGSAAATVTPTPPPASRVTTSPASGVTAGATGGVAVAGTGGAVAAAFAPAQAPGSDPAVDAAVEETRFRASNGPEQVGGTEYMIGETLARTDLTPAQKDEYVARLVDIVQDPRGNGAASDNIGKALNAIGADGGQNSPPAAGTIAGAFDRLTQSGRINGNGLHALADPARFGGAEVARQLMTQISDGAVLNQVADKLLTDAQRFGYDFNTTSGQQGVSAMVAAADVANMAAAHGYTASATAVLNAIDGATTPNDMTLVQGMLTRVSDNPSHADRGGMAALTGLINSADVAGGANATKTDNLFATLVRSGTDAYIGGLGPDGVGSFGSTATAADLTRLGSYFDRNIDRLVDRDQRYDNSDRSYANVTKDFVNHVLLDPAYAGREHTTDVMTTRMADYAARIDVGYRDANGNALSTNARQEAAAALGTLTGSIEGGAKDYVNAAHARTDERIALVRSFSDLVTDKLKDRLTDPLGPAGKLIGKGADGFVDALWQRVTDLANAPLDARVTANTGKLVELGESLRGIMGDTIVDGASQAILDTYDQRHDARVDY